MSSRISAEAERTFAPGRRAARPAVEETVPEQSGASEAPAERTYGGRRSNGESEAEMTGTYRAIGGRRAAEPVTGTIPVITEPLLGDEPGGRRIRRVAPVSSAPDSADRRVTRSFDHTGEIPAVQFTLPPREMPIFAPIVPASVAADEVTVEPVEPVGPVAPVAPVVSAAEPTPEPEPELLPDVPEVVLPSFDVVPEAEIMAIPESPAVIAPEPIPEPSANESAEGDRESMPWRLRRGVRNHVMIWGSVLLVGVLMLALAALHVGPSWLDGIGATAVLTAFCWAAAARTGGRKIIFSALGFGVGLAALLVDGAVLRSGAAVMTCVVSGVLAVVFTVPARTVLGAVREVAIATAIASVGAFATVGFEPTASTSRFDILTLTIGMVAMVVLVWRFAAGLHGLGTRGLLIVGAGAVLLGLSQLYTELLRNYGASGMVQPTGELGAWLRDTIGASPRMIMVLLGVPALLYGVHMRARRRQGWWVCTFGAAATLPVAQRLVNLDTSYVEAGLQTFYSVALGCLVGFVVIRLDQRFTGTRGARARALEKDAALRPEPRRFSSL